MQMWVWMAPNHVKAIWKVLVAENPIVKKLFNFEIGFSVRRSRFGRDSLPACLPVCMSCQAGAGLVDVPACRTVCFVDRA